MGVTQPFVSCVISLDFNIPCEAKNCLREVKQELMRAHTENVLIIPVFSPFLLSLVISFTMLLILRMSRIFYCFSSFLSYWDMASHL